MEPGVGMRLGFSQAAPSPALSDGRFSDAVVESFLWSGRNRNADRLEAAGRLATRLEDLGDTPVIVVAHSHGGNVARSASYLAGASRAPRIIATLGTPFLSIDGGRDAVMSYLVFVMAAFLDDAIGMLLLADGLPLGRLIRAEAIILLTAMATWIVIALVTWALAAPLRRWDVRQLRAVVDPPNTNARLLTFVAAGEEASLALGVAQFLGVLTARIPRPVYRFLDRPLPVVVAWAAVPVLATPVLLWELTRDSVGVWDWRW